MVEDYSWLVNSISVWQFVIIMGCNFIVKYYINKRSSTECKISEVCFAFDVGGGEPRKASTDKMQKSDIYFDFRAKGVLWTAWKQKCIIETIN